MTKYSVLFIIVSVLVVLNSCTVYKKSTVNTMENLRIMPDIRIFSIYTVYGDTITIDHSSKIITRISDYDIKFIDREGNVQTIPLNEISALLIREEDKVATTVLRVTGIVLTVALAVALVVGIFALMMVALSA